MKPLLHRIEYILVRLVGFVFRSLPIGLGSRLSGLGWRLIAPHLARHGRALANLRAAYPEKSEAEREKIARRMWDNLGRTFAESFNLRELAASGRVTLATPEAFASLIGRASIVCGMHIGNWEVAGCAIPQAARTASIYQRIKNPILDAYAIALRRSFYPGGLHDKSANTPKALLKHGKAGHCIGLMADLRDKRGIDAAFFGRPAPTSIFPALAARALRAPVFVGWTVRDENSHLRVQIVEVPMPRSADRDADIAAGTAAIQAQIEAIVRAHPDQWMWAHRRWG